MKLHIINHHATQLCPEHWLIHLPLRCELLPLACCKILMIHKIQSILFIYQCFYTHSSEQNAELSHHSFLDLIKLWDIWVWWGKLFQEWINTRLVLWFCCDPKFFNHDNSNVSGCLESNRYGTLLDFCVSVLDML